VLGVRLAARVTPVRLGRDATLHAVELDARRAFARWLRRHRRALGDILEHGSWLDRVDVEALLDLAVPGVDELMGLLEIVRLAGLGAEARSAKATAQPYDLVVVDTAPTGHTLRLLSSPAAVRSAVSVLDSLQERHRLVRRRLAGFGRAEPADLLIELLERQAREAAALLRDRRMTRLHWITLAEEVATAETQDAMNELRNADLHVAEVIVNRVTPRGPACPLCDRRREYERAVVASAGLRAAMAGRLPRVRVVEARLQEPRGIKALKAIGDDLHEPGVSRRGGPGGFTRRVGKPNRSALPVALYTSPSPLRVSTLAGAQLLFCGGKGGVGKTTVAAALALGLSRRAEAGDVLLLSTDPAHSLGDVLGAKVAHRPRPIPRGPSNLHVRELDARLAMAAARARLKRAIGTIAESQAGGFDTAVDGSLRELIELAPPGIDELFGMLSILNARASYRTIVVDTAPTGHTLRLLEMPEVARNWVQTLLRLLLKYRQVVRPGQLGSELVELSRELRELQALLRDRERTRFIVITRAAEIPRVETERLSASLRRFRIARPFVVVNALTIQAGRCPWCRGTRAAEQRELGRIARTCRRDGCAIIQAPLAVPPPRGVASLERWSESWLETIS
jgi:arsenite-transporting ATPase